MKILIYKWGAYLQHDICELCREKGISFREFMWKFESKNRDEKFDAWFQENIAADEFDVVLSVNYFPVLSEACKKKNLKYIAWCYDAPLNVENIEETLGNANNYVFLFDKMQFVKYDQMGFETVYHLPLGVNSSRMRKLRVGENDQKKYAAEVSLVGNLYESKIHELLALMEDYTRGYLKSLMDIQSKLYGCFILDDLITEELINDINAQYLCKKPDTAFRLVKPALTFAMTSEITRNERLVLLNLCGRRFDTKLYSGDESILLNEVKKCGLVDYVTEMPKVFACSKVNLNPSLRIIQTGIPLRAFDVMGAGGFLISNYQQELLEYFENEVDMVVYESMEDAVEKIQFYLQHEELREKIALNGRNKTLEEHSLQKRLDIILGVAGL